MIGRQKQIGGARGYGLCLSGTEHLQTEHWRVDFTECECNKKRKQNKSD